MKSSIIFLTLTSAEDEPAVHLLIDSLRTFGGALANVPFWVFAMHPEELRSMEYALENESTRLLQLEAPVPVASYPFGKKVAACASAENLAPVGARALVWIDPTCLIVQPPELFDLGMDYDAAFRPVHIGNVGLSSVQPLDAFWQGIYHALDVDDISTTVTSFVDNQRLRTYFNTHAFVINPVLGLMNRWYGLFQQLVNDVHFQTTACPDVRHQIFLFQAVLSALVASSLNPARLLILPPTYNYPYNLQEHVQPDRRAEAINDLICFTYEGRTILPDAMTDIHVREPLRTWLEAHVYDEK